MQLRYRGRGYEVQSETIRTSHVNSECYSGHSDSDRLSSTSVVIPPVVVLRYRGAAYLKF